MKDGGPAYPCEIESGANMFGDRAPPQAWEGMSLRDWFAGQALVGLLANPNYMMATTEDTRGVVMMSFAAADAMLKAREKSK